MTLSYLQKKQLILAKEEEVAQEMARKVIDKPEFSIWMILIPLIFIFHFQFYRRWKSGVKLFTAVYLGDIRNIFQSIEEDQLSEKDTFPQLPSSLSASIKNAVRNYQIEMKGHYKRLLSANGKTYTELVRCAYPLPIDFEAHLQKRVELTIQIEDTLDIKDPAEIAAKKKLHAFLPVLHQRLMAQIYANQA